MIVSIKRVKYFNTSELKRTELKRALPRAKAPSLSLGKDKYTVPYTIEYNKTLITCNKTINYEFHCYKCYNQLTLPIKAPLSPMSNLNSRLNKALICCQMFVMYLMD